LHIEQTEKKGKQRTGRKNREHALNHKAQTKTQYILESSLNTPKKERGLPLARGTLKKKNHLKNKKGAPSSKWEMRPQRTAHRPWQYVKQQHAQARRGQRNLTLKSTTTESKRNPKTRSEPKKVKKNRSTKNFDTYETGCRPPPQNEKSLERGRRILQ